MPRYVSTQGIINAYGEEKVTLLADKNDDGEADLTCVVRAIAFAEGLVDSYLGVVYDLPLPGIVDMTEPESNTYVPGVLPGYVADIALYRLAADHDKLTKELRQRYEDALAWLQRVADGGLSIGLPDPTPTAGGGVEHWTNERIFTRDKTDGLV
jgi:phage gp36-like protein